MYLREMGSVELLSREGEIAIAKRIEAGREAMIAGLCESPLTFQAIIIWRDELNEGKVSCATSSIWKRPTPARRREGHGEPGAPGAGVPARRPLAPAGVRAPRWSPPPRPRRRAPTPFRPRRRADGNGAAGPARKARARRSAKATWTTTTWRIRSRSPRSRPS
jgi:RNA polymerase primary sigma factor